MESLGFDADEHEMVQRAILKAREHKAQFKSLFLEHQDVVLRISGLVNGPVPEFVDATSEDERLAHLVMSLAAMMIMSLSEEIYHSSLPQRN